MSASELRHLLKAFSHSGFECYKVNDGEEIIEVDNINSAVENACAVDESWIYIKHDMVKVGRIYLVFGNNPGELVSDWNTFKNASVELKAKFVNVINSVSDSYLRLTT